MLVPETKWILPCLLIALSVAVRQASSREGDTLADCSFDSGTCGFVDTSVDEVYWIWSRKFSGGVKSYVPEIDYNRGNSFGSGYKSNLHYMVLRHKSGKIEGVEEARLESPLLGPSPEGCQLTFQYFITVEFGKYNYPPLEVQIDQSGGNKTVWSQPGGVSDWKTATVSIGSIDSQFKIVFVGRESKSKYGTAVVAFDDLKVESCDPTDPITG